MIFPEATAGPVSVLPESSWSEPYGSLTVVELMVRSLGLARSAEIYHSLHRRDDEPYTQILLTKNYIAPIMT